MVAESAAAPPAIGITVSTLVGVSLVKGPHEHASKNEEEHCHSSNTHDLSLARTMLSCKRDK